MCFFFFFQAEDGIRDGTVTGVQTCALPIWPARCLVSLRRGYREAGPGSVVLFPRQAVGRAQDRPVGAGIHPLGRQSVSPIRSAPHRGGRARQLRRWLPRAVVLACLLAVTTGCKSTSLTR